MATFGNTNTVGGIGGSCKNRVFGTLFPMNNENGIGVSITADCLCTTTNKKYKCAIYDSGSNLLAVTEEKTLVAGAVRQQVTFNFTTSPSLTANAQYYLVAWVESLLNAGGIDYEADVNFDTYRDDEAYDGFPNPAAFAVFVANNKCQIFCTYTPVAAGLPMGLVLTPAPKGGVGRPAMLTGGASFGG